ncbi:hypothetical protein CPB86DRAFT_375418 [Serendipita vermifera]|nr:hypothetical protein CPB86DRAFT_375418 [Serendipita vermifera]
MSSSTPRKCSASQPYSQEFRPKRQGSTSAPPKDPRQQLNERVQKYYGPTTKKLKVECQRTEKSESHAQRWKCSFFLNGELIGESQEKTSKANAKKEGAEKSLSWMADKGFP